MRIERLWEGKLPSYWDITKWFTLANNYVVVLYRDMETRKRIIEIFDLEQNTSFKKESIYNILLGNFDTDIYLGRVTDARSHVQINRLTNYDIICRSVRWTLNESFLVEKFKIADIGEKNIDSYGLGNKVMDLKAGIIRNIEYRSQVQGWQIGDDFRLEQHGSSLVCINDKQESVWIKEGLYGNWYHGVIGNALYFLLPEKQLLLLDKTSGDVLQTVDLMEMKVTSQRVMGSFDHHNDSTFDSCTIADVLVHEDYVCWVTEENEVVMKNIRTGQVSKSLGELDDDLCLSVINSQYIMLYGIKNADYGSLLIVRMEGFENGASNCRTS